MEHARSVRGRRGIVAVTGIGMICPLGISTSECWENMLQGKPGVTKITKFDADSCLTRIGGQLPPEYFELEKKKTSKRLQKQTVRATRIIRLCAQEAMADSQLDVAEDDKTRCAVIIGTSGSSVRSPEDMETPKTAKFKIIREMINAMPAWISLEFGFQGPTYTVSADSASGSAAIIAAYDLIVSGAVDVVIAGGVDYLLSLNNVKHGNSLGVLSTCNEEPEKAVKPFDKERDGYVISDGGCAVVLESYEHALQRNARIYAWMVGRGISSTPSNAHLPVSDDRGMARAMRLALDDARIPADQIGYVNAHGTATYQGDLDETRAIKQVFGNHANRLLVSSQKSMIGHTIGGAAAIEFAVTALALYTQKIPPTINYHTPDPECDLNYVPNEMVSCNNLAAAISNAFAPGGHNNVLVLAGNPRV